MHTKLPSAIVYGWNKLGRFYLQTTLYQEENLFEDVLVYSLNDESKSQKHQTIYDTDVIIKLSGSSINETELANLVLLESTKNICQNKRPLFSVFTSAFKSGERIIRAYNSILSQKLEDWEWIVIDDSPDETTWNILIDIAKNDYRVKIERFQNKTMGNIGLAKNRCCSLANGHWLVELDHDDELLSDCLLSCKDAINKYPDSKFFYSDFIAKYEDESPLLYSDYTKSDFYANPSNNYTFGYCGNLLVEENGKQIAKHYHCDMNPLTIRFNIGMPNHVRVWNRLFYNEIGGHNKKLPVADDYELIVRTFLNTRMTHIKKPLYCQRHNHNSTVDNNSIDINRRARLIRDFYDEAIHNRIVELGFNDWSWIKEENKSERFQLMSNKRLYYEEENILNYIYE
jgi:glycosyltransferase involved in cell wall biosynthesis